MFDRAALLKALDKELAQEVRTIYRNLIVTSFAADGKLKGIEQAACKAALTRALTIHKACAAAIEEVVS